MRSRSAGEPPGVAEVAVVVSVPHDIKGNAICAFVTLKTHWLAAAQRSPDDALKNWRRTSPRGSGGPFPSRIWRSASPTAFPKTRSGKIMAIKRATSPGVEKDHPDTTTLEDFSVIAKLRRMRSRRAVTRRCAVDWGLPGSVPPGR